MRGLYAFVGALSLCTTALTGQTYGEWDRPCSLGLPPRFSQPFVHGVIYQGEEFQTQWRSVLQTTPLPSYNWYEATPDPNPLSTTGTARWDGAKVQGHCTVERTPYYISYHTYPVAYQGTVRQCGSGGGGGGPWYATQITDPPTSDQFDPYGQWEQSWPDDCSGSSGTGGGGGGSNTCHDEYVYVEVSYDDGLTWQVLWEGWAVVCG